MPRSLFLLVAILGGVSCSVELDVPEGARITCSTDAACGRQDSARELGDNQLIQADTFAFGFAHQPCVQGLRKPQVEFA